jgi:hypothetical protein
VVAARPVVWTGPNFGAASLGFAAMAADAVTNLPASGSKTRPSSSDINSEMGPPFLPFLLIVQTSLGSSSPRKGENYELKNWKFVVHQVDDKVDSIHETNEAEIPPVKDGDFHVGFAAC